MSIILSLIFLWLKKNVFDDFVFDRKTITINEMSKRRDNFQFILPAVLTQVVPNIYNIRTSPIYTQMYLTNELNRRYIRLMLTYNSQYFDIRVYIPFTSNCATARAVSRMFVAEH